MAESLMVTGLDEVMDWPAVWNPENPSYERIWGMIGATFAARGVVEGPWRRACATCRRSTPSPRPGSPPTMKCDAGGDLGQADARPVHRTARLRHGRDRRLAARRRACRTGRRSRSPPTTAAPATRSNSAPPTTMCGSPSRLALRLRSPSSALTINPARHMRLTPCVGSLSARPLRRHRAAVGRRQALHRRGLGRRRAGVGRASVTSARVPRSTGPTGRPRRSMSIARSEPQILRSPPSPGATP